MRICLDFDDVLCETARALSKAAAELFARNVPYEQIKHFDLAKSFRLDNAQYTCLMHHAHTPEFLLSLEPTPGSLEGLRKLLADGHDVTIATGRPGGTETWSRQWLAERGFSNVPVVCVDKYGRNKALPGAAPALSPQEFAKMPFDIAVDDSPTALNLLLARENCRVFVFDRPWNTAFFAGNTSRISSLIEMELTK